MAMIYAQSRSELQTIMSMPLEYQRADALDDSNRSSTVQCLDGSVICNVRTLKYHSHRLQVCFTIQTLFKHIIMSNFSMMS